MKRFDQLFLGVVGMVFLGLGFVNLFFPAAGMASFEMQVTNVSALNEIRANYGGMHFALGVLFVAGTFRSTLRIPMLLVVALFTGGLVVGRLLGMALDGMPNHFVLGLFALEALGCIVAATLYVRAWREASAPGNA